MIYDLLALHGVHDICLYIMTMSADNSPQLPVKIGVLTFEKVQGAEIFLCYGPFGAPLGLEAPLGPINASSASGHARHYYISDDRSHTAFSAIHLNCLLVATRGGLAIRKMAPDFGGFSQPFVRQEDDSLGACQALPLPLFPSEYRGRAGVYTHYEHACPMKFRQPGLGKSSQTSTTFLC